MAQNHWLSNGHSKHNVKRPIRIAGASGGVFDRFRSIEDFAADPTIDVIFGDWMSEISMAFRGSEKADRQVSLHELEALSFEMSFIAALKPGIKNIAKHKQKVAVNAGACDPEAMARRVQDICVE
jgi:Icc-related predicted phosphoesterase